MIRPIRNRHHHSSQFIVQFRTLQTFSKNLSLVVSSAVSYSPFYCTSDKSSMAHKSRFHVKCIAWLVPIKWGTTAFTK